MQAGLLELPGWETDGRLAQNPRYQQILQELDYPPSPLTAQ